MFIKSFDVNYEGRDIAVGDIHGHFSLLMEGLTRINFDPKVDRLFATGDLVDRGPENLRAREFLNYPWFETVRGNHDDYVARFSNGLLGKWGEHAGKWFFELSRTTQMTWETRFREIPILMEVETPEGLVGIVHANNPFETWDQLKAALRNTKDKKHRRLVVNTCMHDRRRYEFKEDHGVEDIRAMVVGHNPVHEPLKLGNVHFIDTYAWQPEHGRFTFLDLHTLEVI